MLWLELAKLIHPAHTKDTRKVAFEPASWIPSDMATHAGVTSGDCSVHFTVQQCQGPDQDLRSHCSACKGCSSAQQGRTFGTPHVTKPAPFAFMYDRNYTKLV